MAAISSPWLLETGYWRDTGTWIDLPAVWRDIPFVGGWISRSDRNDIWIDRPDPGALTTSLISSGFWSDIGLWGDLELWRDFPP